MFPLQILAGSSKECDGFITGNLRKQIGLIFCSVKWNFVECHYQWLSGRPFNFKMQNLDAKKKSLKISYVFVFSCSLNWAVASDINQITDETKIMSVFWCLYPLLLFLINLLLSLFSVSVNGAVCVRKSYRLFFFFKCTRYYCSFMEVKT